MEGMELTLEADEPDSMEQITALLASLFGSVATRDLLGPLGSPGSPGSPGLTRLTRPHSTACLLPVLTRSPTPRCS
mgnify:CR=1 FL=1